MRDGIKNFISVFIGGSIGCIFIMHNYDTKGNIEEAKFFLILAGVFLLLAIVITFIYDRLFNWKIYIKILTDSNNYKNSYQ